MNYCNEAGSKYQRDALILNKVKTITISMTLSHNFLTFSTFIIIIMWNMQMFNYIFPPSKVMSLLAGPSVQLSTLVLINLDRDSFSGHPSSILYRYKSIPMTMKRTIK